MSPVKLATAALALLSACADTAITTTNPGEANAAAAPAARAAAIPRTSGTQSDPVPPASHAEACDASNAYVASGTVPPTWAASGKVIFTIAGNVVAAEEAVDAAGKTVAQDSEKAALSRLTLEVFPAKWICQLGAVAVVDQALTSTDRELSGPSGGKVVFDVFRPSAADESTDLALLCHEPDGQGGATPLARLVGMHAAAQWMTTRHYRALAREVDVAIAEAASKDVRRQVARSSADKIEAQARARGVDDCAYARVLRDVAAAK